MVIFSLFSSIKYGCHYVIWLKTINNSSCPMKETMMNPRPHAPLINASKQREIWNYKSSPNFRAWNICYTSWGWFNWKLEPKPSNVSSSESQWSIPGWTLQRHIYETMPSDLGLRCLVKCQTDDWCQSFNFVLSRRMREFSDRTKEEVTLDSVTTLKLSTGREVPLNFRCFILFIRLQI